MMDRINHRYTSDVVCPYCGTKVTDSWELEDEGEYFCDECDNEFDFVRNVSVTYSSGKKEQKCMD